MLPYDDDDSPTSDQAKSLGGTTAKEREIVDRFLLPVALSRRGVEEVLAIYAERALGAAYGEDDLRAPGIYGKTRRDWNSGTVLARFMDELLCPLRAATR